MNRPGFMIEMPRLTNFTGLILNIGHLIEKYMGVPMTCYLTPYADPDSLKLWYVISCSGSSRGFTHSVNRQKSSVIPMYFGEFITCNIFKTAQNFALKFSELIRNMIFI